MSDGIQVKIFRPERQFGIAVHVFQVNPLNGKREVWYPRDEDNAERWVEVDPNQTMPPSLYFPDEVAFKVMEAISDFTKVPLTLSSEDLLGQQLADSNGVRDRLLTMVEGVVGKA